MPRDDPEGWKDGDRPRSRDDLVALLRAAMARRVHYLDAGELGALAEGVLIAFKRHGLRLSVRRSWTPPRPPPAPGATLADWRWPTVEVACNTCLRQGVYHREKLIGRLGADVRLPDLAARLAEGCTRQGDGHDGCGVFLPQLRRAIEGLRGRKGQNHRR